jgi:hypothetical protein
MLHLSTEYYIGKAHPQRFDVAFRRTASVHGPETDVRSENRGRDAIVRHEVLRGPSVGIVLINVRYRVNFSNSSRFTTIAVTFSLAGVYTGRGSSAFTPSIRLFLLSSWRVLQSCKNICVSKMATRMT